MLQCWVLCSCLGSIAYHRLPSLVCQKSVMHPLCPPVIITEQIWTARLLATSAHCNIQDSKCVLLPDTQTNIQSPRSVVILHIFLYLQIINGKFLRRYVPWHSLVIVLMAHNIKIGAEFGIPKLSLGVQLHFVIYRKWRRHNVI